MGADFLYAVVPLCTMTDERMAHCQRLIEQSEKEIALALTAGECNECDEAQVKTVKAEFGNYADWPHYREAGILCLDSTKPAYIITGGMSWGEGPTELFDVFSCIENVTGLWQALLGWAEEDIAARNAAAKAA